MLFGGSWGATLALIYAQTHPNRVLAMIIRGVFAVRRLGSSHAHSQPSFGAIRRSEIEWLYQSGASQIFPDYWEDFIAPIPEVGHQ